MSISNRLNGSLVHLWDFIKASRLSYFFFLKRIRFSFSGKGHKMFINKRNTVVFHFGHSHLLYVYNNFKITLVTKTRGNFFGLNSFLLRKSALNLQMFNPINIYTARGVRLGRQVIKKKIGKVSLYM